MRIVVMERAETLEDDDLCGSSSVVCCKFGRGKK